MSQMNQTLFFLATVKVLFFTYMYFLTFQHIIINTTKYFGIVPLYRTSSLIVWTLAGVCYCFSQFLQQKVIEIRRTISHFNTDISLNYQIFILRERQRERDLVFLWSTFIFIDAYITLKITLSLSETVSLSLKVE